MLQVYTSKYSIGLSIIANALFSLGDNYIVVYNIWRFEVRWKNVMKSCRMLIFFWRNFVVTFISHSFSHFSSLRMQKTRTFFLHVPARIYKVSENREKPIKVKNVILVRKLYVAPSCPSVEPLSRYTSLYSYCLYRGFLGINTTSMEPRY